MKKENSTIRKAITICGNQTRLAQLVGVTQKTVSHWLHGSEIKARYIPEIVLATNGALSAADIMASLRQN